MQRAYGKTLATATRQNAATRKKRAVHRTIKKRRAHFNL